MTAKGTYVYCLVAAERRPSLRGVPRGVPGSGPVRLLPIEGMGDNGRLRRWLVVADAPLERFGERIVNRRLQDLDWVSRAAVAHEAVVESFVAAPALLPMKLLTIFTSDDRAVAHMLGQRARVGAALKRVMHHDEWGIRVVYGGESGAAPRAARAPESGAGYLAHKKAQRDRSVELASRSKTVVAELYDDLASLASGAEKRGARDMPVKDGPLLLDAAFLVPRSRVRRFRRAVAREARRLAPGGYRIALTGPWPPYSFLD